MGEFIPDADAVAEVVGLASSLKLPNSWRAHVKGFGTCLGLCAPPHGPDISTLEDNALPLLRCLNQLFAKAALSFGNVPWSSVQCNKNTLSDWRDDKLNMGPHPDFDLR